jgi:gliding motility-associated-like protein
MLRLAKIAVVSIVLHACVISAAAQGCTTRGQTPGTAFPVCGLAPYTQTIVPGCVNSTMVTSCPANGNLYADLNPFYYKFTCFTGGTLGFLITPNDINDDYDWQLFDITGHDPNEIYTNLSLIIGYNWSGETGITGTSLSANNPFECGSIQNGPRVPVYSAMAVLQAGHQYLMMISHFTAGSQSGYSLLFKGGTADITDPSIPAILNAYAVCDGTEIVVKLNKKMKCNSLAADGSDFAVTGPVNISIVSASGNGCSSGFDMDSVTLKLNRVLSPGTYKVTSRMGLDGNTLTDNCDNDLATGQQASLKFISSQPTPMDSITPVICIKDTLQLVFSKPMKCSSIAADGSDFIITGPAPVTVKSATGICTNGISTIVQIILSARILVNGNYQVRLKNGSDGNPLIDECDQVTPAGSVISFTTKDIATAGFTNKLAPGCLKDSIFVSHDGNNNTSQWSWTIDSLPLSSAQNTSYISALFGAHTIHLSISNGNCSDTASTTFIFPDQSVKAAFMVSSDTACNRDTLRFTSNSSNNVIAWKWDFGNGQINEFQDPGLQTFPGNNRPVDHLVKLMVRNAFDCADTAYHFIYVLISCDVSVPTAFTPNNDGLNDYLYPLNAFKASNLMFRIYSRAGQVLFLSTSAGKKWDGRVNGLLQPSGTYVWTLEYIDITTKRKVSSSGTTVLIR